MGVLDQVVGMKSQGIPDSEIARRLQEQGISPMEINDAFSRAQIKSAVSGIDMGMADGMQPSILATGEEPDRLPTEGEISDIDLTPPTPGMYSGQQLPMHVTKEISEQYPSYSENAPAYGEETYYPQPQYQGMQQENSPVSGYGYSPSMGDTDTVIEIAEQVFSEKNKPFQRKIDEMNEFRGLTQTKVDNISERLRRMESIIDRLQASILEKIGSYGQDLDSMRKEMSMMQNSFGKMINQVADSTERHKHHTHHLQKNEQNPQHHEKHHIIVHKSRKKTVRKISKK